MNKYLKIGIIFLFSGCSTIRVEYVAHYKDSPKKTEASPKEEMQSEKSEIKEEKRDSLEKAKDVALSKDETMVFHNSYKISTGHQVLCWVTGFMWGGWCWTYLKMPFDREEIKIKEEAMAALKKKLGKEVVVFDEKIKRINWKKEPPYLKLSQYQKEESVADVIKEEELRASKKDDNKEGFIERAERNSR